MSEDWLGSTQNVMATLNASSHSKKDREQNDYYATHPKAVEQLLRLEIFKKNIWECACGEGHISKVLTSNGYSVKSTDLIHRGFGDTLDFLKTNTPVDFDIITNPPFSKANDFLIKAMDILVNGGKLALFLRIQFLEGVKRRSIFRKYPPKVIYVASRNIRCAKNGDFKNATGNASTYCWFIWEKGYTGEPIIRWFNE